MNNKKNSLLGSVFIAVIFGLLFIQGCWQDSNPKLQGEYQAVVLTNGQYFFGKAEFVGKDYLRLKDVFYIYPQINRETKQVNNVLIKKGNELHGADQMYINTRHIIAIEPVSSASPIGKMIKGAISQKTKKQK